MRKERKNEKGFTMVELIIVVAIMGIIGALLVPAYGTMSAKARLTTDVSTVKTLKRTAESYKAEKGAYPDTTSGDTLVSKLATDGYLENSNVKLQTAGAKIGVAVVDGVLNCYVDTTPITDGSAIKNAVKQLSDEAKSYVKGNDGTYGVTAPADPADPT